MTGQVWIAIAVGLAASIEDLLRRRISNWIPLAALLGGFAWHIAGSGWRGAGLAAAGALAGFAVFLVFYLLGGMGGGDVKLMAGFGALLGPGKLLEAALLAALAGGLWALAVIGIAALKRLLPGRRHVPEPRTIPYAPAITAGVWLALVPR